MRLELMGAGGEVMLPVPTAAVQLLLLMYCNAVDLEVDVIVALLGERQVPLPGVAGSFGQKMVLV